MDFKSFFQKNWSHLAALAFIVILTAVFYQPQMDGMRLKQHDVQEWKAMSNEIYKYREISGDEPLWTNSLFGGMPAVQVSMSYYGNIINTSLVNFLKFFPSAIGLMLLHLIGFYIFALFLRIPPLIALLGAVAFSFSSYEIIIVQAGHITKSMASAFLAPILGAFIYSFRSKSWLGVSLMGLFLILELSCNHLQVTYYFAFLLIAVGILFFVRAYKNKELKSFFVFSAGMIGVAMLAVIINFGNILLTMDYSEYTIRGNNDLTGVGEVTAESTKGGLDKDYITNWSYGIGETATLISPDVKGGGTFQLGGSQYEDIVEKSDFSGSEQNRLKSMYAYWGEQPITSGPVYLGVVIVLLAFLGLFFLKDRMKWVLLIVTVFAVALSWGKNFMWLTDFFIDYVPGYNKFRTVTIILIVVELTAVVLGVLYLNEFVKNVKSIDKKKLIAVIGSFFLFLLILKVVGLGDNYWSKNDQRQLDNVEASIRKQLSSIPPGDLQKNYGLNISNRSQVDQFVDKQMEGYEVDFGNLKEIRSDIFHSSMNRSLIFTFLAGVLILLYSFLSFKPWILTAGLLGLTMIDLIPIAHQYIGDEERFWTSKGAALYPISAQAGDEQVLQMEVSNNAELKSAVDKAGRDAKLRAVEEDLTGAAKTNFINSYRFSALNFRTNYRVFDLNGGFSSGRASYFHKSLGGYHGAKLRNIGNMIDFHLTKMNEKVLDMFNVKYFLRQTENGHVAIPRPTAMGPVWLSKEIETYKTPDEEIRALGNRFKLKNVGEGKLLVNGNTVDQAQIFGNEKLQYLTGTSNDTLEIPIRSGLRVGEEVVFVMDVKGTVNLVPKFTVEMDTASSFTSFVSYEVDNEFKPRTEAVMLESEAAKLSGMSFTGEGTVTFEKYSPKEMKYKANVKGKQFAVFSEVYYPDGWKAFVDGKETEIIKTNYMLRGLEIPNGEHEIVFKFELPKYRMTNNIALISCIVLFLLIGGTGYLEWKKRKKQGMEDIPSEEAI